VTNISKEDIFKKHLAHEIDMLRQTYRKLGEGQLPDVVVKNALFESFCVHGQSLLDFFGNLGTKPDDFIAAKFTVSVVKRIDVFAAPLEAASHELNKQIFHLTGGRKNLEVDQFNMSTDGKQLIDELEQEIYRFEWPRTRLLRRCRGAIRRPLFTQKPTHSLAPRTAQASSTTWQSSVLLDQHNLVNLTRRIIDEISSTVEGSPCKIRVTGWSLTSIGAPISRRSQRYCCSAPYAESSGYDNPVGTKPLNGPPTLSDVRNRRRRPPAKAWPHRYC
jgi:hypothetical protein